MSKKSTSAIPMNLYKNGSPITTDFQLIFNDQKKHRNTLNSPELNMVNVGLRMKRMSKKYHEKKYYWSFNTNFFKYFGL